MAGLPVEERLLEAVVVRLVATAAERRRHDELLEQHHYLHNPRRWGKSCGTSLNITEPGWRC